MVFRRSFLKGGVGVLGAPVISSISPISSISWDMEPDFRVLDPVVEAELKANRTPGAAVAVVRGDRVVYARGFGAASVETGAAATPAMLFRLGSTTKMMTASAVLQLAEAGRLDLDAPIGKYMRGLPARLSAVTAHQLLSQSAGLRDFAASVVSDDEAALGAGIRTWTDDVFFTEPGRIYSYSSPGYWLAGLLAEEVGGKPYATIMRELFFAPLGMSRSTLRPLEAMTWPLALGHTVEDKQARVVRPFFNNTAMWPGGSVFSSVEELSRLALALINDGRLDGRQALPSALVARLQAPQMRMPGEEEVHYGYGVMNYRQRGVRIIAHGGASRGYGSMIELAPEARFGVIVVANRSGETLPQTRAKAREIGLKLEPESPQAANPQAAPPLSAAELGDFAGRYRHAPMVWEFFARDGRLVLRFDGKESALTRLGRAHFTSEAGEFIFVPGADGRSQHLFMGLYAARKEER